MGQREATVYRNVNDNGFHKNTPDELHVSNGYNGGIRRTQTGYLEKYVTHTKPLS